MTVAELAVEVAFLGKGVWFDPGVCQVYALTLHEEALPESLSIELRWQGQHRKTGEQYQVRVPLHRTHLQAMKAADQLEQAVIDHVRNGAYELNSLLLASLL